MLFPFDLQGHLIDEVYSIPSTCEVPYRGLLQQQVCEVSTALDGQVITLKNNGSNVVSALTLECDNSGGAYFSKGCMMLLPNEKTSLDIEFVNGERAPVYISGFGVPYQRIF